MATFTAVASSAFTGTDENPLSEGGNWATTNSESAFQRITNTAAPTDPTTDCGSRWTGAGSFNNDQYSRANLTVSGTAGGGAGIGLGVRQASAARTFYRFTIDHAASNNAKLSRFVSGVSTGLVTFTQSFTDGDQFTLGVEGQTLFVYDKNTTLVQSFDDTGGGGPTSGTPRIVHSSTETSASLDNWEGGNFTSGTAALSLIDPAIMI